MKNTHPATIVVYASQRLVREAIVTLLADEPRFEVVGDFADLDRTIEWIRAQGADILILDLPALAPKFCSPLFMDLRRRCPGTRLVHLSGDAAWPGVIPSVTRGADACIARWQGRSALLEVLLSVTARCDWPDAPELPTAAPRASPFAVNRMSIIHARRAREDRAEPRHDTPFKPITRVERTMKPNTVLMAILASAPLFAAEPPQHDERELNEVVVTAPRMLEPLVVSMSAKAPRQPLPANDGADYLKTVPGFSVIRKGGADGDPVFRGMAASRINIQVDGEQVLGGCGMRMDPPTAYVFPEAYDRIVVVKGPQTVLHGPGNSAASVSFERSVERFAEPGYQAHASALGASFGRSDLVGDLRIGTPQFYGQLTGTRAKADDFSDGDGRDVHSAYRRWSGNAALGWTPGDDTRIELSGARSDGEAAYADRMMDGALFARDNVGLRLERRNLSQHVQRLQAQVFYNYVDHVMDNYSLRTFVPSMMMPGRSASNPDRRTTGAKVELDLGLSDRLSATFGVERQENRHTVRSTMNETMMPYEAMARAEDGRFRSNSVYAELTWRASEQRRVIAGLRADDWSARDSRQMLSLGMTMAPNPTAGAERSDTLAGGFARFESDMAARPATLFIGVGHVERFPDYWELISAGKETTTGLSAFGMRPERTTQLDTGVVYRHERVEFSLSGFVNDVADYILIQANFAKGMRSATVVRNIDASTWGGEADATVALTEAWKLTGTLAYTRGQNRSDDVALAQIPPLETRLALDYDHAAWSAGALLRVVAAQDRYALNQGSIVGQDIGPTSGFAILSLNAGWRPRAGLLLSAGVDNLFDRAYAEHLSRAGSMVTGFLQTTRVNEPGRTLWLRASADFR